MIEHPLECGRPGVQSPAPQGEGSGKEGVREEGKEMGQLNAVVLERKFCVLVCSRPWVQSPASEKENSRTKEEIDSI